MGQYKEGQVSVTNGSDTVVGIGTLWLSNVLPNSTLNLFNVRGELAAYAVTQVVNDTTLKISPPYAGSSKGPVWYNITRDFSGNYDFYLPSGQDSDWPFLLSQNLAKLDNLMGDITQMVGVHVGTDQPTDPRAKLWLVPGTAAVTTDNFPVFTSQPSISSTTSDGGVVAYGTSDTEGDHYKLETSTDGGSTWTLRVSDEIPGSGKTVSFSGLASGSYQIKLRITALTGNATPVVSSAVTLTVGTANQAPVFSAQPSVQSANNDGGVISYGTSDAEGDHHKTEISTNNGSSWSQVLADEAPGAGKTVTISGLTSGQSYTVKLRITALTGNVTPVVSTGVLLTVPVNSAASFTSQPSVSSVTSSSGVIAYGTNDTEGDHYKLEYSTNGGTNYTTAVANETPGAGKTLTITGLSSGQAYSVKLRLTPLTGNTTPTISNQVTLTTQAPPTFSAQPTVQSTNASGGVIAYGTQDVNGDHYRLDVSTDGGSTWTTGVVADETPGSGKSVALSGLTAATYSINLRLSPLSGDTTQVVSNAVSMTITSNQAPSFTAQPSVSSITADGCILNYGTSDPENDQYKLEMSSNGGTSWSTLLSADNPGSGKFITLSGFAEGSYSILLRLTALTGNTTPVVSNVIALTIDKTPSTFSFADQTGVATSTVITSDSITVSGINAPSPISVTGGAYSKNGGAYTSAVGTVINGDTITVQVTSSANTSTTVNCTLTIGGVSDTFSATTVALAIPSAPVMSSVTGGDTQLTANWADVSGETSYTVYYSTSAALTSSTYDGTNAYPGTANATAGIISGVAANSVSRTITGLSNSTTYYIRVAAVNSGGTSALSNSISAVPSGVLDDPSFESGAFVTDTTTGWKNDSLGAATASFVTSPSPTNGSKSVKLVSAPTTTDNTQATITQKIFTSEFSAARLASLNFDIRISSADTNIAWNQDVSGGTGFNWCVARMLLYAYDSIGNMILNSSTSGYSTVELFGHYTFAGGSNPDTSIRTNIALDTWVTKTFNAYNFLNSRLAAGKTWSDVNYILIRFSAYAENDSAHKIGYFVDNVRF